MPPGQNLTAQMHRRAEIQGQGSHEGRQTQGKNTPQSRNSRQRRSARQTLRTKLCSRTEFHGKSTQQDGGSWQNCPQDRARGKIPRTAEPQGQNLDRTPGLLRTSKWDQSLPAHRSVGHGISLVFLSLECRRGRVSTRASPSQQRWGLSWRLVIQNEKWASSTGIQIHSAPCNNAEKLPGSSSGGAADSGLWGIEPAHITSTFHQGRNI